MLVWMCGYGCVGAGVWVWVCGCGCVGVGVWVCNAVALLKVTELCPPFIEDVLNTALLIKCRLILRLLQQVTLPQYTGDLIIWRHTTWARTQYCPHVMQWHINTRSMRRALLCYLQHLSVLDYPPVYIPLGRCLLTQCDYVCVHTLLLGMWHFDSYTSSGWWMLWCGLHGSSCVC